MKFVGACLVVAAGYLWSLRMVEPERRHLFLLEEGVYLLGLLASEMREEKMPLPELFSFLAGQTDSQWKQMYLQFSELLLGRGDVTLASAFERLLLEHLGNLCTKEEIAFFSQAGRSLFSSDLHFQEGRIQKSLERLARYNDSLYDRLANRKKVYQALGISMSVLIVIILI